MILLWHAIQKQIRRSETHFISNFEISIWGFFKSELVGMYIDGYRIVLLNPFIKYEICSAVK